jgi:hypothetical protein
MKRSWLIVLAGIVGFALFAGLVHAVLVAANLSEPVANTVQGFTPRRIWATTASMVALLGVVTGGLALRRSSVGAAARSARSTGAVTLACGLFAALNGGLNLALANGGPGTGNGVVGGAAAFVLGVVAMGLGAAVLVRSRSGVAVNR